MLTLWLILLAGFLGSFHCAAMCGPFSAYNGLARGRHSSLWQWFSVQAAYQVGRLFAYLALGTLVGSLGQGLLYWSETFAIQKLLMIALGMGMVGLGIKKLLAQRLKPGKPAAEQRWSRLGRAFAALASRIDAGKSLWHKCLGQGLREARRLSAPVPRAALIGLCATLLPCGYLYGFALAAAASGSILNAVLVMAAFWLGTMPALLAVGFFSQQASGFFARWARPMIPILMILFGLLAISGKWQFPRFNDPHGAFCHSPYPIPHPE